MSKDVDWNTDEVHLKDDNLSQLPDNPNCPNLVKLSLKLPGLTIIPPTFFQHMPHLGVLDISNTNILSLPSTISSLVLLKEFFLRDCLALIELPPEIGMLTKLKLFDISGTEIMYMPKEIGNLEDLEYLRVSLSLYADYYIKTKGVDVIPRMMISKLKKLKELCISVSPQAKWWENEVEVIQHELRHLVDLKTLQWYMPTNKVLHQFLQLEKNRLPMYASLSNFMLTIGQHAQLTSCLPHGLEKKFEEFKRCLKWINGEGSMDGISSIMKNVEALFLSRHWTLGELSTLNITNLKYCLLVECNEMKTLVEVDEPSSGLEACGLESLQYLSIHYMKELQSIWKGPIGKYSLSKLTIFALHTCPSLTTIFTISIAQNLSCLAELIVEDCPKVENLISYESPDFKSDMLFPSLEKIFLLDLPELVSVSDGLITLEKVHNLLIHNCLKLTFLSVTELPHIKEIKGDTIWWNNIDCDKSKWESIFVALKEKRALVEQLFEATNSLQHFNDGAFPGYDGMQSDWTDVRRRDDTTIKGKGMLLKQKGITGYDEMQSDWTDVRRRGVQDDTTIKGKGILLKQKGYDEMQYDWTDVRRRDDTTIKGKGMLLKQKEIHHLEIQLEDIKWATNNFDSSKAIGHVGFEPVYKGEISRPEGQITVAFKRLDRKLGQGDAEFRKEVMMLSKLKHKNLISLLGFCMEGDERILVYEYVSLGSLDRYLSDPSFTWIQRLQICIQAAHAISYIHDPTHQWVVNCDIRSSNILLDENWTAKVSNPRLTADRPYTAPDPNVLGRYLYLDPLYLRTGRLTRSSDVYAFGVVLLEVMCGKLCYEYENNGQLGSLVSTWKRNFDKKRVDDTIFDDLKGQIDKNCLKTFSTIAYRCLSTYRKRPTMVEIVHELEIAFEQQLKLLEKEGIGRIGNKIFLQTQMLLREHTR